MSPEAQAAPGSSLAVVVAARNEADRIGAALEALATALPDARVVVADDASGDGTADIAMARGAEVVSRRRPHGKGANVGAAADAVLSWPQPPDLVLLCDADLASSAAELRPLVATVEAGECDLAIATFRRRVGGGFGIALGFARRSVERATGKRVEAPLSGQRAMRIEVLRDALPLAGGFGLETGMTIDAIRAGYRIREIELDLEHRATHRTLGGFVHRARQLLDIARAYLARR